MLPPTEVPTKTSGGYVSSIRSPRVAAGEPAVGKSSTTTWAKRVNPAIAGCGGNESGIGTGAAPAPGAPGGPLSARGSRSRRFGGTRSTRISVVPTKKLPGRWESARNAGAPPRPDWTWSANEAFPIHAWLHERTGTTPPVPGAPDP